MRRGVLWNEYACMVKSIVAFSPSPIAVNKSVFVCPFFDLRNFSFTSWSLNNMDNFILIVVKITIHYPIVSFGKRMFTIEQ